MTHQEALVGAIIGTAAMKGNTGATSAEIRANLPILIIDKVRKEMAFDSYYTDDVIFDIIMGKVLQRGELVPTAPSGIIRFVIPVNPGVTRQDFDALKKRVQDLEEKVWNAARRNFHN